MVTREREPNLLKIVEKNKAGIMMDIKEHDKNTMYFEKHYSSFQKKYAGKIIVICRQRVVAKGTDPKKVVAEHQAKDRDPVGCFITYIPKPNETLIL